MSDADRIQSRLEQAVADREERAKLKGSHEGDLDRETAERDAARYAVAEAEARREMPRRDRASLESRIGALRDAEAGFHPDPPAR